jgi:plastocyanin
MKPFAFTLALACAAVMCTDAANVNINWNTQTAATAAPGDTITFNWSGGHNVERLASASKHSSCDMSGSTPVGGSGYNTSGVQWTVPVDAADNAKYYFACSISGHCAGGQKLILTIDADYQSPNAAAEAAVFAAIGFTVVPATIVLLH